MKIYKDRKFLLNGQTIYPTKGRASDGYVVKGREWDLIEWVDLGAVTAYIRDKDKGLTKALDFEG